MVITASCMFWYLAGVVIAFLLVWLINILDHKGYYMSDADKSTPFGIALCISLFSWFAVVIATVIGLTDLKPKPHEKPKESILRNLWDKGRFT